MGQGLRVFNEYGLITLDTNAQLCRILGQRTTDLSWGDSGRVEIPEFATGIPWAIGSVDYGVVLQDTSKSGSLFNENVYVKFTIEGNGLKWQWLPTIRQGPHYSSWVIFGVTY